MTDSLHNKKLEFFLSTLLIITGLFLGADLFARAQRQSLTYSEFKSVLQTGEVKELVVGSNVLDGTLANGKQITVRRIADAELVQELQAQGVRYAAQAPARNFLYEILAPALVIVSIGFLGFRHRNQPFGSFGKRGSNLLVADRPKTGFEAVAGCDEAKSDLKEIVDFMARPERYQKMGASLPRGVLLSGPPGTGKTLLARALAAEAHIPFFSLSGSDFVEKYVGVGAARVRNLFDQARKQAPCIVFIDEIDALGKSRNNDNGGNDERDQTLNQLLVELDGFDRETLVLLIGATNRPDIIDPALMRPGRFDRQVVVDAPDKQGRLEILRVHVASRKLCADTRLEHIANSTPGMSGADLANIVNESALLAAREQASCISEAHFREALERVIAGPVRTNRLLNEELRRRVAYHEAGHALVAHYSETADPVHKISIVPRGKAALGYTMQMPISDSYLLTKTELRDRIRVLLGGRAAECLVYNEVSTGAENDLERCTAMAKSMMGQFGMGEKTGLLHIGRSGNCSVSTSNLVEQEANLLLGALHEEALQLLRRHHSQLEKVTEELLKHEVLNAEDFEALLT